ncbi:MAG: VacB/RNase II family 3'-5' exoribonuclease, partial [Candidatus Cloacimonetes bacterium]|nr:VacB/RNase II family 3'-5' exoribonuclease [Candidatus Cloacimonadota bacterium]
AKPGEKVVLKILNWGNRDLQKLPVGNIIEILGKAGDPEVEILSIIKQYELPLTFPENVLQELNNIHLEIPQEEIIRRTDLRKLTTITIDPASAKDFDDAVSLEKNEDEFTLYVHIADVAHYVSHSSNLFAEAVKRGNSYYFPKKVIPMLPEKISNKVCSLRPFEEKLTLTMKTVYNADFSIKSQEVVESVIKSDARFNYDEIDAHFEGEKKIDKELVIMLDDMRKLSSALSVKNIKHGYLSLNIPETEFIFDEDGHITDLQRSRQTESHKLIENFMLVANEFVAKRLSAKPTIYRIHEEPEEEKLVKLKKLVRNYSLKFDLGKERHIALQELLNSLPDESHHRVFDKVVLRSMKRAKYTIQNMGHFGLALQNYTHFTSPIRRICDLVVHHQIKDKLNSQQERFDKNRLIQIAESATENEMIADEAEREVDLKNKLNFIKKHLGEEFEGIIVAIRPALMIVELDRYPVTGIVEISSLKDDYYNFMEEHMRLVGRKSGKIYKLTDNVKVFISRVDDDIYFQIME